MLADCVFMSVRSKTSQIAWTEKERQPDPQFDEWARIFLVPSRFQPTFRYGADVMSFSADKQILENEFFRVEKFPIETPGGEPLDEYRVLKRKSAEAGEEISVEF